MGGESIHQDWFIPLYVIEGIIKFCVSLEKVRLAHQKLFQIGFLLSAGFQTLPWLNISKCGQKHAKNKNIYVLCNEVLCILSDFIGFFEANCITKIGGRW